MVVLNLPTRKSSLVEKEGHLQLDHPMVSSLVEAFTRGDLGDGLDALSSIIPAVGKPLPPDVETNTRLAASHRKSSEWDPSANFDAMGVLAVLPCP